MKKNIKLFSMTLCCLAVMALSSCLSSNDDDDKNQEKEWGKEFQYLIQSIL